MSIPKGVINFDHFHCSIEQDQDQCCFTIDIKGCDRKFNFKALTVEECQAWIDEISVHLINSEGFKKDKSSEGNKKPWRFDNISEL